APSRLGRVARPPPSSPLFPYTTLFRSLALAGLVRLCEALGEEADEMLAALVADEDTAWRLVAVLGASRALAQHLAKHPGHWRLLDRKSTRLNSSHVKISYAVFCLKKKK